MSKPAVKDINEESKIEYGPSAAFDNSMTQGRFGGVTGDLSTSFHMRKDPKKSIFAPGNLVSQDDIRKDLYDISKTKTEENSSRRAHYELMALNDEEEMKKNKHYGKNLINPIYKKDNRLGVYREVNKPPESLYMALGYNPTPNDK